MSKLFIGKEVEGPERGKLTLFIPKNAENRFSFLEEAKRHKIKRLYFGAGNDRGISFDLAPILLEIPNDYSILFEIDSFDDLVGIPLEFLSRTKIILVVKTPFVKVLPSVFKIETMNNVQWYELNYPYTSAIDDKLYKKDKIIE